MKTDNFADDYLNDVATSLEAEAERLEGMAKDSDTRASQFRSDAERNRLNAAQLRNRMTPAPSASEHMIIVSGPLKPGMLHSLEAAHAAICTICPLDEAKDGKGTQEA